MADKQEMIRLVEFRGLVRLLSPYVSTATGEALERLYQDLLALRFVLSESSGTPTKEIEKAKCLIRGSAWLLRRDAEKERWATYRRIPRLLDVNAWIEQIVAVVGSQECYPYHPEVSPPPTKVGDLFVEEPESMLCRLAAELRFEELLRTAENNISDVNGRCPKTIQKEVTGKE